MSAARRALLIIPREGGDWEEAWGLARTAGYEIVDLIQVRRRNPFYIGRGKLEELRESHDGEELTLIVFDDLKPREAYGIARETGFRVIDRTQLILEIFALHAGSQEAMLQIELARIKHELPLIREIINKSKLGELPGFLGPGRYATESYYRMMRRREARIRKRLEEIRRHRALRRASRARRLGIPQVAITGYTNAGKTTLFNLLTRESKATGPTYFTTLSPKSKCGVLGGHEYIFIDTVGFIEKVPPHIIEAFYATLEEIIYADAVMLVLDASLKPNVMKRRLMSGLGILSDIGVSGKPLLAVANKIDSLQAPLTELEDMVREALSQGYHGPYTIHFISALRHEGIRELGGKLWEMLGRRTARCTS
jgi:GTP-binding protein HflX